MILVTGATGFVGNKIMEMCEDVSAGLLRCLRDNANRLGAN